MVLHSSPFVPKLVLPLFLLSSCSTQRLSYFALFPTISQHRIASLFVFPLSQSKRSSPFVPKRVLPLFLLSSCNTQRLSYFALFPTISQHRIVSLFVFPLSQSKRSSPFVPKRVLPLFLFLCHFDAGSNEVSE